jgi:ABC-2 type transport system ATP-binding protein
VTLTGPAIELAGVEKSFVVRRRNGAVRRERVVVRAVDDLDLVVQAGELIGFLGPNGAGKSTTVKMCTGILVPTAGRVRILGFDPARERLEVTRRIGVVFGQRTTLWWDLPLADSFALLGRVYRMDAARARANLAHLVETLELGPLLDVPVRQLSLGQRMRGDLAAAFLHDPQLVFLDEPTIGLDVVSKAAIREFLATVNREAGTTIVLTTHDLDDVERLCSRVAIIDHGHVVHDGPLAEVVARFGDERTLVVDLVEAAPPIQVPGATVVRVDGPRQWLRFGRDTTAAALVAAVAARHPLRDLSVVEPDIEEVIRRFYADRSL